MTPNNVISNLDSIDILEDGIRKKLGKLNPGKSTGPDCHNLRVLTQLHGQPVRPLQILFQKSLDDGYLPKAWWETNITPIFKKREKCKSKLQPSKLN